MKFDFCIGNPPYQEEDGGAQASAKPVYNSFVDALKASGVENISLVMPARWYTGGKGLDEFRDSMLNDEHMKVLYDYPITEDCFKGVNIRGGVCFFLWSKEYDNSEKKVRVVTSVHGDEKEVRRSLKYGDCPLFIRYDEAINILDKVMSKTDKFMPETISSRKPFGLSTDFNRSDRYHETSVGLKQPVKCISKGQSVGFVESDDITVHKDWIKSWKVFTPYANNIGTELPDDNLNTIIAGPGTICTETYIVIGYDLQLTEEGAKALSSYLHTRFVRFLLSLAKASQHATAKTYCFVPLQDFTSTSDIDWLAPIKAIDQQLYKKYNLSDEEINFIETHVKEME